MSKMKEVLFGKILYFTISMAVKINISRENAGFYKQEIIIHDTEILINLLPYAQIRLGAQN